MGACGVAYLATPAVGSKRQSCSVRREGSGVARYWHSSVSVPTTSFTYVRSSAGKATPSWPPLRLPASIAAHVNGDPVTLQVHGSSPAKPQPEADCCRFPLVLLTSK